MKTREHLFINYLIREIEVKYETLFDMADYS